MTQCDMSESGLHQPVEIHFVGKADSVDLKCVCGEGLRAGTWWKGLPPGWTCKNWGKLILAAESFIEAVK